jgi:hypothetical protein
MIFRRSSFPGLPVTARQSRNDSGWSAVVVAVLLAVVAGVVIALVALLGGGKETVASRSAAAFEEAKRKGLPVGEAAHGGHAAPASGGGHAGMAMPGSSETAMPEHAGMEMPGRSESETTGHGGHAMTGSTASGSSPHAGTHHGTAVPGSTAAASPHAGMQHGTPAPRRGGSQTPASGAASHAGHGGTEQPPAGTTGIPPPEPLAKSAVSRPGQPAATLEPDLLDTPAVTSQIDAKRGAEMAAQAGHGMAHGTGTYRQLDAGRESAPQAQPAMPDHQGMDHGPVPGATPKPATGPRPAVTPAPTPRGRVHPGGGPR